MAKPPPLPGFVATLSMIGVLGLMMSLGPQTQLMLALDPKAPSHWWFTLLTWGLVHGSMLHFFVNIAYIVQVGPFSWAAGGGGWRNVASLWGVFALGTLVGGLAFLGSDAQGLVLVGASGGASAMAGFYVIYGTVISPDDRRYRLFGRAMVEFLLGAILLPILIAAFFDIRISWEAHAAGFASGLLVASWVVRKRNASTEAAVARLLV